MTQQESANYIIAYGYNDKFYLTEEEAAAIVRATEEGKKIVKFSKRVFTTNYTWIMPIDEVKSEQNPILQDPKYQQYLEVKGIETDTALRQTMALENYLNRAYPYEKFSKYWEELGNKTTAITI